MIRASVIVVNYNGGAAAVQNLRRISERMPEGQCELIVVDNASDDGSPDRISAELPAVRLVREPSNGGYARGVNRGLREAAGSVAVILNSDVTPEPGALDLLVDAADTPGFAVVGGLVVDDHGRSGGNCVRALPRPGDILLEGVFFRQRTTRPVAGLRSGAHGVLETDVVSGSVMAISRSSLEVLGPMDENFFLYREDVEWCRRALAAGMKVGVATGAVFTHEGGASTRLMEGPAFAARVLSDFHYFCDIEGVSEGLVRRLWRARLAYRTVLYWFDAVCGVLGGREESRRRSAVYRILLESLRDFRWSGAESQSCHPSRLASFPVRAPRPGEDGRPTVLLVVPDMEYGGVQRRVEYLTAGALTERYRFEVLCLRRSGPIGKRIGEGVTVHEVGVTTWGSPATWRRIRDYCALLRPELVHSGTFPADVAAFVGFGRRVPRVSVKVSVDTWMTWPLRLLERVALSRARAVYCIGDAVADVKSHLGRRGLLPPVIPNPVMIPVADEVPRSFPEDGPIRLVCLGRLDKVKRVDVFVRLARALEDREPGRYRFRVLGDGRERRALESLAGSLGLSGTVEFAGGVADVPGELDRADIVPMFSAGEGGPFTVLETIARGRVPVVLRAGGAVNSLPPELGECFVSELSVEAYADKVADIVANSSQYLERVHAAKRELYDRASFHDLALDRLYDEALGRPAGSQPAESTRTKVLHLITRLIIGGAQENTIASVERVNPERYDSRLWCGPQTGSEGSLFQDARDRGEAPRVLANLVREISPWRDLVVTVQLMHLLRRGRFDIVHTHSSKAGIVGRIAAKLAGVPHIIHTVHGWGFHEHMNPVVRLGYVISEKVMKPLTRPLVTVSNRTTAVGLAAGIGRPEDYRLIRSGIPLSRFGPDPARGSDARKRLGIAEGDVVVGSVGRLTPQKNPMDFVRVASGLLDRHKNVEFLYVGDGPMRDSIESAVAERGIAEKVRLLGLRDDVPDLLRAMDVFILTSLWEGLPRVVLQALATGLAVVAYDTAGIGEAVKEGQNGYMVEPGAVGEMVELLDRLVADASLRAAMGRAAAEELDRAFTEDGMIRDLENLYDELTMGTGGGVRSAGKRPEKSRRGLEGGDRDAS